MVQQVPKTKKIKGMHQEFILVRMYHGLWPTQGSTQGAYLFNCYASTLSKIVPDSMTLTGFSDDHLLRKTFKPEGNQTPTKANKSLSE